MLYNNHILYSYVFICCAYHQIVIHFYRLLYFQIDNEEAFRLAWDTGYKDLVCLSDCKDMIITLIGDIHNSTHWLWDSLED
ncbi:hypothetical protein RJT34_20376 [Clitoria ternatea]|uniref:Uncharacterized protein n=1 Tax=Clitoria ternatea TaxID=43366 RepID=A0AAN9ISQ1_CLITE